VTPDSSVVVAAFASWNEHHPQAIEALAEHDVEDLVAHAELESYSVLTRLPEPFRAAPELVAEYLHEDFPGGAWRFPNANGESWSSSSRHGRYRVAPCMTRSWR
jgi:hypothetical protein